MTSQVLHDALNHHGVTHCRVLKGDDVLYSAGPQDEPLPIHSVRKSIISALFGQLVDDGSVRLDSTLRELGIDDSPPLTPAEKSATLEHLLTSSSGVYLPLNFDTSFDVFTNTAADWPSRESSVPGARFHYNNWDFNVLGEIYQRVSGTALFVAVDRLLAQLEAKAGIERPILIHALLETPQGVVNVEEIAFASPRMQGMSFGPADLAAARRMKTTRVGGGHPGYLVLNDPPDLENPEEGRVSAQQDLWHYSIARMVDACTSAGILPFYGPFGDIKDVAGCEAQFRAAFLMGCVGAWSLHPVQIGIAKKVFSPPPDEVAFAKKVLEAIPDGRGVHMIDGKMQDDATWKQCKVMVELAEMLAEKDPDLKEAYGL